MLKIYAKWSEFFNFIRTVSIKSDFSLGFKNNSVNTRLSRAKFLEMFGLLGMESMSYICERMFDCIDSSKKQWISFCEYMDYMDVLIHGTEKEKLKQSFGLLDIRGRNKVTQQDFYNVAMNVTRMWSVAYGKPGKFEWFYKFTLVEIDQEVIERVFNTISGNKKYFKCKDYVNVVRKHPDLMSWLTKPKEKLDEKLEANASAKEQCYSIQMVQELIQDSTM